MINNIIAFRLSIICYRILFIIIINLLIYSPNILINSKSNDIYSSINYELQKGKIAETQIPTITPTQEPSQSPLPSLIDCTESCLFPDTYLVTPRNPILYLKLPRTFTMKFEYQVLNQSPYDPSYKRYANIFDIYSVTNKKSLLSISFEPNTNQICIFYNGVKVLFFGPTVHYSFNTFSKFEMTLSDNQIVINNGGFNQFGSLTGTVSSDQNIFYASSNIFDGNHYSAGGTIRNIYFEGFVIITYLTYFHLYH